MISDVDQHLDGGDERRVQQQVEARDPEEGQRQEDRRVDDVAAQHHHARRRHVTNTRMTRRLMGGRRERWRGRLPGCRRRRSPAAVDCSPKTIRERSCCANASDFPMVKEAAGRSASVS